MPQVVTISANGTIVVQECGPIGPPGPGGGTTEGAAMRLGGNVFKGDQEISIEDMPFTPIMDAIESDMELTMVTSITGTDGELVWGVGVARLDMSAFGGPAEVTGIGLIQKDPTSGDFIFEQMQRSDGPDSAITVGRIAIADLKIASLFTGEPPEIASYQTGTPELPSAATPKSYVDDLFESAGGAASNATKVSRAVKYAKKLGGRWALVGGPGHYETPDVGPLDQGGIVFYARVKPISGDPGRTQADIHFWEIITQFRNSDGATFDQDNLEIATYMYLSRIGLFEEDCLISTPFPVASGEYAEGRVYSEQHIDVFPEGIVVGSGLDMTLGDAMEIRFQYVYDRGDGRWTKTFWIRTDAAYHQTPGDIIEWRNREDYLTSDEMAMLLDGTSEDLYWKQVITVTGPPGQVGSIADAGLPFHIGRNRGIQGIEVAQLRHLDTSDLILDFQSKDIDPVTGIGTSLLVPGQTFTPYVTDGGSVTPLPVIDDSPVGMWKTEQRLRALE